MKYFVLLCDGMADEPQEKLGGKTLLEYAKTPNMDLAAKNGICGFIHTTPAGFPPGSDICNLSVMGYPPEKYYSGRSPLEAASMGIALGPSDMAFRCNLVDIKDGCMESFCAHHIETEAAKPLIDKLQERFKGRGMEFYSGLSYRHLLVVRGKELNTETTPPHDISGQPVETFLPKGMDGKAVREIMREAAEVFGYSVHGVTGIWLWGQGKRPSMPAFKEMYGVDGAVVAAVDLIKGIGTYLGLEVLKVPGVTGFLDTNFEGKAEYAINALKEGKDYVFVHVEAPDEAGHLGSLEDKITAIENIDSRMLPIIFEGLKSFDGARLLITCDHATPIRVKTHTAVAVPAVIMGTGIVADENSILSENIKPSFEFKDGYKIAEYLFKR